MHGSSCNAANGRVESTSLLAVGGNTAALQTLCDLHLIVMKPSTHAPLAETLASIDSSIGCVASSCCSRWVAAMQCTDVGLYSAVGKCV
jgi:hypothetical protein